MSREETVSWRAVVASRTPSTTREPNDGMGNRTVNESIPAPNAKLLRGRCSYRDDTAAPDAYGETP
jgi:hypothetical protein